MIAHQTILAITAYSIWLFAVIVALVSANGLFSWATLWGTISTAAFFSLAIYTINCTIVGSCTVLAWVSSSLVLLSSFIFVAAWLLKDTPRLAAIPYTGFRRF